VTGSVPPWCFVLGTGECENGPKNVRFIGLKQMFEPYKVRILHRKGD
jgi:hypothetical protein